MSERLTNITQDMRHLALLRREQFPQFDQEWTFDHFSNLVNSTGRIRQTRVSSPSRKLKRLLQTPIGENLYNFMGTDLPPWGYALADCCQEAEGKLLHSLSDDRLEDEKKASPLIVVSHDIAVGVIKSIGTRSLYGLVDNPQYGIIEAGFSAPDEPYRALTTPRSGQAWFVEAEQVRAMGPLRLSRFAFDPDLRPELTDSLVPTPWDHVSQRELHSNIKQRIDLLLEAARPLPPQALAFLQ